MEVTQALLDEIKSCCHHGHGASVFEDGTVYQSINCNDVIAKDTISGWEYRICYINDANITMEELNDIILDQLAARVAAENDEYPYDEDDLWLEAN